MDNDAQLRLWRELDAARDKGRYDVGSLMAIADKANVTLDFDTFQHIIARMPRVVQESSFICPSSITEFMTEYLRTTKAESILDPQADSLLLIPLVGAIRPQRACGVVRSPATYGLATTLQGNHTISWQAENFLQSTLADDEQFDAIVSCAPFGLQRLAMPLEVRGKTVTVRDNEASLLVLKAIRSLKPDGVGLFVVPNNFFHAGDTKDRSTFLSQFGLCIDAAIAIPAGMFRPVTGAFATLIVIRRGSMDRMFVGQLSVDQDRNSVLLQNLLARRRGKEPALGMVVTRSAYHGFEVIAAQERARDLARSLGISARPLREIVTKFNLTSASQAQAPAFVEQAHAIYIPLLGQGTALSQATMRNASRYIQLILNPDIAVAEYVAQYFNTPLGIETRRAASLGSTIGRIAVRLLEDMPVYLPDRETQLRTIETTTQIENLLSALEALRTRAWTQPRSLKDIAHELQAVNREETFPGWLDTLPFPLASILWAYHTIGDDHQRRYERLLQYFEAQAEFLSAILIAGFQQDAEWLSRKKSELNGILFSESGHTLKRGTFGVWVHIAENLAKEARTYLNGKEQEQERCFAMFKTADRDTLSMLFSSDIIAALQQANDLRNKWTGHTGVVGPAEARERHTILESLLAKVRRIYSTHWRTYRLIKAGTSAFENGVYHYGVDVIMGTRTPFEPDEVLTDQPMEHKRLYMLADSERQPLKLLPLIQVMPSPKTAANACYFYNREQGDKLRFVSYHFEQDAEIVETFADTKAALQSILE